MGRRFLGATLVVAALVAATLLTSTAATPADAVPLSFRGDAGQVVTVVADSASATTAVLTAWQRTGTGWSRAYGPVSAFVGKDGVGQASESTSHTPAGVWKLTEAFGIQPNNGTRLPYRQVTTSDWWVSDVKSPYYNTHFSCVPGTCPFNEAAGEDLGKAGPVYDHAVVLDYNRSPAVPGAGSAFFLHVSNGKPTAGCVSIPGADLDAVMRWLDPARHPVADISVSG
ncbi:MULTISPECIES: L,D-transpeptidase family protein [unclassified Amycolatopsis]|uniref:L,D-transpeptidase family protein n=1 Tax=unclassified Amycolatopsis TaxID=2618356 RepID=UPI002E11CB9C|nr:MULTISPECIES: L,D-transpeptidase family protein [unclassified Amycolatopsis]WSJ73097.1 L,D-transpeptidase family protein [Amycolatopsis sp. NBC_01307]WSK83176.1 L,D-transpeptidase family protein [Amycolatopsis sp. NBC_01286]